MPSITTKLSSMPEMMAGAINGNVTVMRVRTGPAPEISAASSSDGSMFRSAAAVNMKT